MTNILSYRGYRGAVEFDPEDSRFVGRVLDIPDFLAFHGKSPAETVQSFCDCIDEYLDLQRRLQEKAME